MTQMIAALPDVEAEARWREWKARGAADDRRRSTNASRFIILVGVALALWLLVQLV